MRCAFTPGAGISATWVRNVPRRFTVRTMSVNVTWARILRIPTVRATACITSRTRRPDVPAPSIMMPAITSRSGRM